MRAAGLGLNQAGVIATGAIDQLLVIARLNDLTVFQHHDLIGFANCG